MCHVIAQTRIALRMTSSRGRLTLVDAYLATYNATQVVLWALAVTQALRALVGSGLRDVFSASRVFVTSAQALTILETLNALLGVVKSPLLANVMQFAGRTHALALTLLLPALHRTVAAAVLVFSWSGADVVRYSWALSGCVLTKPPHMLTWLRYSVFLIVYPCGALAEAALLYAALPMARAGLGRVAMPNAWNFIFHYDTFLVAVLLVYAPLFLQLYTYMLRQRRKKLKTD